MARGTDRRRVAALTALGLVLVLGLSSVSLPVTAASGEAPSPIPTVKTSAWKFVGVLDGGCEGEWAETTHHERTKHEIHIAGYEVVAYEYEHTEVRIDWKYKCGLEYEVSVDGSGGVERRVGMEYRYEGRRTVNGVSIPISDRQEDSTSCVYLLWGCSFDWTQTVRNAHRERWTNVKSKPEAAEVCLDGAKIPQGFVAYNRPKRTGDPPGTIPGVEDTEKVGRSPNEGCWDVPIEWDKTHSIGPDASVEGLAMTR